MKKICKAIVAATAILTMVMVLTACSSGSGLTETQQLTKEMYEFIAAYMNGNTEAKFERGKEFGENLAKIMEEGDVTEGNNYYPAPTAYDEAGAAFVLTYDDVQVFIDMVDGSVTVEPLVPSEGELPVNVKDSCMNLYYTVDNFAKGVAVEAFPIDVEAIYNNWSEVEALDIIEKPTGIREYAATNEVFLDFAQGYSVRWNMDSMETYIEETNQADVEDYAGREHK